MSVYEHFVIMNSLAWGLDVCERLCESVYEKVHELFKISLKDYRLPGIEPGILQALARLFTTRPVLQIVYERTWIADVCERL